MDNLDDPRLKFNYRTRERGTVPMDGKRDRFQWVSEVAYKNVHRIVARGYDTTELVEAGYGLTDVLFIDFQARIPLVEEEKMLNYMMVCMFEDGLSSPANMARVVASGKTLLTQAAGASILAFGHAYGAYQTFGRMLDGILARQEKEGNPLRRWSRRWSRNGSDDPRWGVGSDAEGPDGEADDRPRRESRLGGEIHRADEGDGQGRPEAEPRAGGYRHAGRLGGRDVRSGVHARGRLVHPGGDPRLRDRRPLLRGDRTGGAGPPRADPDAEGVVRRTGRPAGAHPSRSGNRLPKRWRRRRPTSGNGSSSSGRRSRVPDGRSWKRSTIPTERYDVIKISCPLFIWGVQEPDHFIWA